MKRSVPHRGLALAALLLVAAPAPLLACGASLFGVAESQVVRVYRAPNPANVVVYIDPSLADRGLGDPAVFERALERSGHQVTVARGAPGLDAALAAGSVDVVVADATVIDSVAADARSRGSDAAMLPVVHAAAGQIDAAMDGYARTLAHDADLREALRAINDLVKRRATP